MIIKVHPDYPSLPILVAQSTADKPQPGQFYVVVSGTSLSWIAQKAYGSGTISSVNRINKSQYNMTKCVYRKKSGSCSSAKVDGSLALSNVGWNDGAWLALCQADKAGTDGLGSSLGVDFQVIWIPPTSGGEPWDLAPPVEEPAKPVTPPSLPGNGGDPVVITVPPVDINIGGGKTITTPGIDIGIGGRIGGGGGGGGDGGGGPSGGGGGGSEVPGGQPPSAPKKAGFPWWLGALLGLGAVSTVIYFAVKDRKKGKKRK
jgi:hypothetical protein